MTTNTNVEVLQTFAKIEASDLRAGIECYSIVERQVQALKGGVASWMFDAMTVIWLDCDMISEVALEAMEKALEAEVTFITSDAAGGAKLAKNQAKLKGNNSLANAWKKIANGLKAGLSMSEFKSCSAMAEECSRLNKAAAELEKAAKTDDQIKQAAVAKAVAEGFDPETEAGKAKVAEIQTALTKKYMEANSVDGDKPTATVEDIMEVRVPEELVAHAQLIMTAMQEMTGAALTLLIQKSLIMSGDSDAQKAQAACDQVLEAIDARKVKWLDTAAKHHIDAIKRGFFTEVTDDADEVIDGAPEVEVAAAS
tara:strand:+ start:91 stop:1023 length:933 start_codon:yes stop_codon:yes gene_type:complete